MVTINDKDGNQTSYVHEEQTVDRFVSALTEKGYVPAELPETSKLPLELQREASTYMQMLKQGDSEVVISVHPHRGLLMPYNVLVRLSEPGRVLSGKFDWDGKPVEGKQHNDADTLVDCLLG